MCTITDIPHDVLEKILRQSGSINNTAQVCKLFYRNSQEVAKEIFANLPTNHPLINLESSRTYKKFPGTLTDGKIALKALAFFLENIRNHYPNTDCSTIALQEALFSSTAPDFLAKLDEEEEDDALYQTFRDSYYSSWLRCNVGDKKKSIKNIKTFLETPLRYTFLKLSKVSRIPKALITAHPYLDQINIYHSKIESFPDSLMNHPLLKKLDLESCELGNITLVPNAFPSITALTITKSELEDLPNWISQLSNLKGLHLDNKKMKKISEDFDWSPLKALTCLYLYHTPLKTLPKGIGNLNITHFDFDEKHITHLPNEILYSTNTYISERNEVLDHRWYGFYSLIRVLLEFSSEFGKFILSNQPLMEKFLTLLMVIFLNLPIIIFIGIWQCAKIQFRKVCDQFN